MPRFGKHTRRGQSLDFRGQAIQLIQALVTFASPVICFGPFAIYRFLSIVLCFFLLPGYNPYQVYSQMAAAQNARVPHMNPLVCIIKFYHVFSWRVWQAALLVLCCYDRRFRLPKFELKQDSEK